MARFTMVSPPVPSTPPVLSARIDAEGGADNLSGDELLRAFNELKAENQALREMHVPLVHAGSSIPTTGPLLHDESVTHLSATDVSPARGLVAPAPLVQAALEAQNGGVCTPQMSRVASGIGKAS